MKQKNYFVLAFILALFAAGAVYLYLSNLEKTIKDDKEYTTALVVKEYIPPRTVITANMLDSRQIVLGSLHENAVQDKDKVVGSVTRVPMYPGEQFIAQKLAGTGESREGLSFSIEEGKRAVAVQVNEIIGVGNMVLPGDRVDVVAVLENKNETHATLLAQNIRVLAVGQTMSTSSTSLQANTFTLEVTPAEGQQVVLATERGTIRLMLRRATEEDTVKIPPFKIEDLF